MCVPLLYPPSVIPTRNCSSMPFWGEMDLRPQCLNQVYHQNYPDKGISSELWGDRGKMSFPNTWKMKAELLFRAIQAQTRPSLVEEAALLVLILDQATGEVAFTNISLRRIAPMGCVYFPEWQRHRKNCAFQILPVRGRWLLLVLEMKWGFLRSIASAPVGCVHRAPCKSRHPWWLSSWMSWLISYCPTELVSNTTYTKNSMSFLFWMTMLRPCHCDSLCITRHLDLWHEAGNFPAFPSWRGGMHLCDLARNTAGQITNIFIWLLTFMKYIY